MLIGYWNCSQGLLEAHVVCFLNLFLRNNAVNYLQKTMFEIMNMIEIVREISTMEAYAIVQRNVMHGVIFRLCS